MHVRVFDKAAERIVQFRSDTQIGFVAIDFEERWFSNKLFMCRLINAISLKDAQQELEAFR
jgi:hypothetical protein